MKPFPSSGNPAELLKDVMARQLAFSLLLKQLITSDMKLLETAAVFASTFEDKAMALPIPDEWIADVKAHLMDMALGTPPAAPTKR